MEWLTSSFQAAQQAASSLVSSDVAEKAKQLAEEARQKAAAFAQEASIKVQVRLTSIAAAAMGRSARMCASVLSHVSRPRCACAFATHHCS